jgi:hypothetical protein
MLCAHCVPSNDVDIFLQIKHEGIGCGKLADSFGRISFCRIAFCGGIIHRFYYFICRRSLMIKRLGCIQEDWRFDSSALAPYNYS